MLWLARMFSSALIALPLIGFLAVGCSSTQNGTAVPVQPANSAPTSTQAVSNRPQEFKLDGLDPCKSLTPEQLNQLGMKPGEPGDPEMGRYKDVANCGYLSVEGAKPAAGYVVAFITADGYRSWNGGGNLDVTPISVVGYDGLSMKLKGDRPHSCTVVVDVADEQHLYVNYLPIVDKGTQELLCQKATTAAEMVLATLPSLN
ncbi:DUF3558 domain-containing protein [Actinosynnema sp. NPDC000082]|nr:Protein of unknown function (DUF3558) [Actinosynnema pretiosum]